MTTEQSLKQQDLKIDLIVINSLIAVPRLEFHGGITWQKYFEKYTEV